MPRTRDAARARLLTAGRRRAAAHPAGCILLSPPRGLAVGIHQAAPPLGLPLASFTRPPLPRVGRWQYVRALSNLGISYGNMANYNAAAQCYLKVGDSTPRTQLPQGRRLDSTYPATSR
ncbi:tetratricopeptide repeat protein [bacterium]|nr:tetratricopeptide repeat protein [bacterium]